MWKTSAFGVVFVFLLSISFNAFSYYSIYENGRLVESNYPGKQTHYTQKQYNKNKYTNQSQRRSNVDYGARLPKQIATNEKVIVIDPRLHAWGAYGADGRLIRSGLATAGAGYCPDIRRGCRTKVGVFRIQSLGSASCKSSKYPLPRGGAPMPYCMFFNGKQGLHGSYEVVAGNVSHGCVRVRVDAAKWIRFNFANIGTKVIVKPY